MKGEGNQQDYGMRVYDPRIGKFLSVDPITAQYPELTPYQFASNSPIQGVDFDGLELINSNQEPHFLKVVGGQTNLATMTATVVTRAAADAGKRMAVNAAGRLIASTGTTIGGSTIGAALLTAVLTIIPLQSSNYENSQSWIDQKQAAMEKAKAFYAQSHIEEFRDPSELSDDYLKGVQDRILKGAASGQDYLYQNEVGNRFQLSDKAKEFFKKGSFSQALDQHYEDLVRAKVGGVAAEIDGREYDAVTSTRLIHAKRSMTALEKPKNFLNKSTRTQIKETINLANKLGVKAEFWFKYGAHKEVVKYIEDKGGTVVSGLGKN